MKIDETSPAALRALPWNRREVLSALSVAAGAAALGPRLARAGGGKRPEGSIRTRPIPSSGEAIPVVGLGTWRQFDVPREPARLRPLLEVLRRLFALGGRVIDSSPMYGRSEETIGILLDALDDADPFLATKVWTRGKKAGIRQMRASMKKMSAGGTLELMQVHNLVDWKTHLRTLKAWKEEGVFRYVGVTHHRRSAFDDLEKIIRSGAVDFVQLPYSIADRAAEKRLLPAAGDQGVAVLVMRPFEGGSLFSRVEGKELPEWAAEHGIESWAQYFLKFLLGHPAVTCPIPGTSDPDHVEDNTRAGYGAPPDPRTRRRMVAHLGL